MNFFSSPSKAPPLASTPPQSYGSTLPTPPTSAQAASVQACEGCDRVNCPCGPTCECGPFCRCITSDIVDAINTVDMSLASSPMRKYNWRSHGKASEARSVINP